MWNASIGTTVRLYIGCSSSVCTQRTGTCMHPEDRDLCTQRTGTCMHPRRQDLYSPREQGYIQHGIELVYTTQECEDLADCITVSHNRRLDI